MITKGRDQKSPLPEKKVYPSIGLERQPRSRRNADEGAKEKSETKEQEKNSFAQPR